MAVEDRDAGGAGVDDATGPLGAPALAVGLALLVVGLLTRIELLRSNLGPPDADESVASLHVPPAPTSTPAGRLSLYWRQALPQVTGFKLPYDQKRWIATSWALVPHLVVVCLVLFGAVMLARKVPWVPIAIAWHPVMFASLSTSFYVAEPRYLFLLWPSAALALAFAAVRLGRAGVSSCWAD